MLSLLFLFGLFNEPPTPPPTVAIINDPLPVTATLPDRKKSRPTTKRSQENTEKILPENTRAVPFYSQFSDISDPAWKKRGCGVASLAMIIDFYRAPVAVDTLLAQGLASGAYITGAGWSHRGLINLGRQYNLGGKTHDLTRLSNTDAVAKLKEILEDGPAIASVHYKMEPTNPIPHLAVINRASANTVYYNDPAESPGEKQISLARFMDAWKKRLIAPRPKKQ